LLLAGAICAGALLAFAYTKWADFGLWPRTGSEVHSGLGSEILVMRTRGGLLEVSRIRATETFDTTFVRSVLGFEVARTVARIRVPRAGAAAARST